MTDINKINSNPKPVERSLNGFNKPFETVYEVKGDEYKVPSFEEFMKSYQADENLNYSDLESGSVGEVKGYGPCKNSLCGCSCSSYTCSCANANIKVGKWGPIVGVSGRMLEEDIEPDDKFMEGLTKGVLKRVGRPMVGASGQASGSFLGRKYDDGEIRFLGGTAGGEINSKNFKGKLSADLYNVKHDGVQVRVGPSLDTGISLENGLEVKAAGFGFSVGEK